MSDDNGIEVLDLSGDAAREKFSKHGRKAGIIVLTALVLAAGASTMFQVNADSVGVVLRFGEVHRTVEPGLHMKFPLGMETVDVVPTRKQLKQEFGFRTVDAGEETEYDSQGYEEESMMLTGDLNVVDVQWTIQYRITEPGDYLFEVRNVDGTLRYVTEAVMREIVGDRTVNEVLTVGRAELAAKVHDRLQELVDRYKMGVTVSDVILQDITPPGPVQPSFNEVNEAQQERERLINEARQEYNAAVPRAEGEAEQVLQQAEGYQIQRLNRAKGQVTRFERLHDQYLEAPEITRQRIYLENLGEVLSQIEKKVIVDDGAENVIPLLPSKGGQTMQLDVGSGQGGQ